MKSRSLTVTAVALVALVPVASTMGCKKPPAEQATARRGRLRRRRQPRALPGAETPELLVERMKAGAAKEDFSEIAACLTPKNRTEMAMAMYMGATMMVAFAEMGAEMGGAMAEGMAGMAGGEMSAEDKKKAEEQKAKAKADIAGDEDGLQQPGHQVRPAGDAQGGRAGEARADAGGDREAVRQHRPRRLPERRPGGDEGDAGRRVEGQPARSRSPKAASRT